MNSSLPVMTPTEQLEVPRMTSMTPAKTANGTDSKFTKNTKVWRQDQTGWSDDEYIYRRNAVYNKIREKWPEEKLLNGRDGKGALVKQEIRDWLRPLVISFNDLNWPAGAVRDRVESQLQPYVSWALYLNRHPPTLNVPAAATSAHITSVTHSVTTTPTLPSYSFVTPSQLTSSRSQDPLNTIQGDYWSQTSSDEDEPAPARAFQPSRKSQSVFAQSPNSYCDWDNVEVVIDVRSLNQDQLWIPMYDLKPPPKHSPAHWADFRLIDLYSKVSGELNFSLRQDQYQFVFSNQPGNFAFHREGAYHIVLKRFSQMNQADQILRLRIEKVQTYGSPAAVPSRTVSGPEASLQTSERPPALSRRPTELQQAARPILISDIVPDSTNGRLVTTSIRRPYESTAERPRKRMKFPTQSAEPSPSANGEATDVETPPSNNGFTAVNHLSAAETTTHTAIATPQPVQELNNIPGQPLQGDAHAVMFSESEPSDQELTQPAGNERTQPGLDPDTITVKMEGAG